MGGYIFLYLSTIETYLNWVKTAVEVAAKGGASAIVLVVLLRLTNHALLLVLLVVCRQVAIAVRVVIFLKDEIEAIVLEGLHVQ